MNSVIEKYFAGEKFCRTDLADDISRLRITKNELNTIVNSSEIQKYYFSNIDLKIKDKSFWNNEYLQDLASKSVAECFTKQYLLYLYEVSIHLNNKTKKINTNNILLFSVLFVILVFIITSFLILKTRSNKSQSLTEKPTLIEEASENPEVIDFNFVDNINQEFVNEQ